MKLYPRLITRQSGSVLAVTLMVGAILGFTLAGYLSWLQAQSLLVARSQDWNTALALAEAGIEEGMAQINATFQTNYLPSVQKYWAGPVNGAYGPRTNLLANGGYSVILIPASPGPTLIATGITFSAVLNKPVTRTVRVTTTGSLAFPSAISAQLDVEMKGNNVRVDSYDSADPRYSDSFGRYDPLHFKAGGNVSSTGGMITVGNAEIFGKLITGPDGSATVGPQGCVGDVNFNRAGQIQDGWYLNDYNASFPDVTPPWTSGGLSLVRQDTTQGFPFAYILGSGDYQVNGDFQIGNNEVFYVSGNARLWVTGSFTMFSQMGSVILLGPGATLKLYVGTPNGPPTSTTLTTVNNAGNAYNFQYYGLPSNTSVNWTGNAQYMGTVYAPQANFYLKGSASPANPFDYQGACTVKSITMDGHFSFHYDENLTRNGIFTGFTVNSWREL